MWIDGYLAALDAAQEGASDPAALRRAVEIVEREQPAITLQEGPPNPVLRYLRRMADGIWEVGR